MTSERGTLFLVVGASGAGKDTLIRGARAVLRRSDAFVFPRRFITRPAGVGGENHILITQEEFDACRHTEAFALQWTANGLEYGVSASIEIERAAGRTVVVNVSRGVIDDARIRLAPVRVILVSADKRVLANRLATRGRETAAEIDTRLGRAGVFRVGGGGVVEIANNGTPREGIERFVAVLSHHAAGRPVATA